MRRKFYFFVLVRQDLKKMPPPFDRNHAAEQAQSFCIKGKVSLIGSKLRKVRKGTEMLIASQEGVTARVTNPGTPVRES